MPTLIDVVYEVTTHAAKTGITHVGKRMDRAYGLDQPPLMPQPPTFSPPAWQPPDFSAQQIGAMATGAAVPVGLAEAAHPSPSTGESYSDQVAQGIACLSCTRGHVATAKVASQEAVKALQAGNDVEARRQWAIVAAEFDALAKYDWDPQKLAATSPADVAIIDQMRPCVEQARKAVGTPQTVALAFGSATESQRFAVSTRFTDRDAHEIAVRHQEIDSSGNYAERVQLVNDTSENGTAAKQSLREARHVLDAAQSSGTLFAAETWAQASEHFERAAVALTPTPTMEQAQSLAETCQSCSDSFYRAYFGQRQKS